jgi:hypothetical protein
MQTRTKSIKAIKPARVMRAAALFTTVAVLATGCSWQSLSMSSSVKSAPGAKSAIEAKVQASPSAKAKVNANAAAATSVNPTAVVVLPPLVRGALASGSHTDKIAAGNRTLVIDYWTTQNVATWTSNMAVPINISAHIEDSDVAHAVEVTQFKATLTTDATADATNLMVDNGQFIITPPYSYGSVMTLPAQPASAHAATIAVEFDLLIETAPKSGQFFRQTVLDNLPLTFVAQTPRS